MKFGNVEMTEVNEPTRSYRFAGGDVVSFDNVTHVKVSPSGTHRLRTSDGKFHIVPPTWLSVSLDLPSGWQF